MGLETLGVSLLAIVILLSMAQVFGYLATSLKQPAVVGELLGGIVLGPSLVGYFYPDFFNQLFVSNQRVDLVIQNIHNFGLMLLMFSSGIEARGLALRGSDGRISFGLAAWGSALPMAFAFLFAIWIGFPSVWMGEAGHSLALNLIVAIIFAVTSLPVISRIFMDLNLMKTRFARIVLSSALLQDIVLYVLLSVALTLAAHGAWELSFSIVWHVVINILFVVSALTWLHLPFEFLRRSILRPMFKKSALSYLIFTMIVVTLLGLLVDVSPVFGAFCGGMVAARLSHDFQQALDELKSFASAFFIPIYFAAVGMKVDLINDFSLLHTVSFISLASLIAFGSIYIGGASLGLSARDRLHYSWTLNARGGPGIVVASLAYDAGIVSGLLFVIFIILALFSSSMAGWWLNRVKSELR